MVLSQCVIPDGCVILPAKQRFLTNKYIPGNDNILSPYFTQRGHMYLSTSDAEVTDFDMKAYIMSRPKQAVPEAVCRINFDSLVSVTVNALLFHAVRPKS